MKKIILVILLNFIALAAQDGQAQATTFRVVIEGRGGLNNIETRVASDLAVRILDRDGRPVAGAMVEFDVRAQQRSRGLFQHEGASGATAGGPPATGTSTRNKVLLGVGAGAGLAALGLAVAATATWSPTSP